MLKANMEFIEEFKKLDRDAQNQKLNEMTMSELDLLKEAGFDLEVNNGRCEVTGYQSR